ncbi:hypothetical protein GCM10020000_69100 [Streptomyces olivoverticillatus]
MCEMRGSTPLPRRVNISQSWQNSPRGQGDPLVLGEVFEDDLRAVGEGVVRRDRHVGGVVEDRVLDEAVGQRQRLVVPVEDDGDVEVAAHDLRHGIVRFHFLQPGAQLGVFGAQPGEGGGEEAAGRRGEGTEQQLAHGLPGLRFEVGLGELDLGEDARGVVGEQPSGVGEPHPAAVLGQQLLAGLALQLGQLLGDGGGRHMQSVGRTADGAVPGDGMEGTQALQVQHVSDATRCSPKIICLF